MSRQSRVVVLVDMDCFYVQVEQRERPELRGQPCVVVQYQKQYMGGGIIAVSYEARKFGVTRSMRANEAKRKCPQLHLCYVPERNGKADLTRYRKAGAEVLKVLLRHGNIVERASIDEAYLDITDSVQKRLRQSKHLSTEEIIDKLPSTFVVGWPSANNEKTASPIEHNAGAEIDCDALASEETPIGEVQAKETSSEEEASCQRVNAVQAWLSQCIDVESRSLAVGAMLTVEMRQAVANETTFSCSAGIACNKVLAKLACGLHKPAQQTILPLSSVSDLFQGLPLKKIRGLGGQLGQAVQEQLNITNVGDIAQFPLTELQQKFGEKSGLWLHQICRGIDHESVHERHVPQSIGCSKNFLGRSKLVSHEQVKFWLHQFAKELHERLDTDQEENERVAQHISVHYFAENETKSAARSASLPGYEIDQIVETAYSLVAGDHGGKPAMLGEPSEEAGPSSWSPPLLNIGVSISQFVSVKALNQSSRITKFLQPRTRCPASQTPSDINSCTEIESGISAAAELPAKRLCTKSGRKSLSVLEMLCAKSPGPSSHVPSAPTTHTPNIDTVYTPDAEVANKDQKDESSSVDSAGSFAAARGVSIPSDVVGGSDNLGASLTCKALECDEGCAVLPDASDKVQCQRCGESVLAWHLPEHFDFHFAQDLQSEEQSLSAQQCLRPGQGLKSVGKTGRKQKDSQAGHSTLKIDRFFHRQQ